jgi:hypothetical protein
MLRCVRQALPAILVGLAAVLPMLADPVVAQTSRPFPATALRGIFQVVQPPEVLLNGEAARLSPGARIRGANNMMHLSGALVGQNLLVHYTREPSGLVHDVWILTPEEAARKPWPATPQEAQRWEFNPSAQTWTRK